MSNQKKDMCPVLDSVLMVGMELTLLISLAFIFQ